MKRTYHQKLIYPFLILICVLTLFSSVKTFEFLTFDDDSYITGNEYIKKGLSLESVKWAFQSFECANYHPLTWLSHLLDIEIHGLDSGGHHQTNLFLHSINCLLLYFCLGLLFYKGNFKAPYLFAFLGTLLFIFHPQHIESFAWVSERKDLLGALFFFCALLSYFHFSDSKVFYLRHLSLLFFLFGLLSKPMVITLPCVLVLMDIWPLKRIDFSSVWLTPLFRFSLKKWPYFVLILLSGVLTVLSQKQGGAVVSIEGVSSEFRVSNALGGYIYYLKSFFFPHSLSPFYPQTKLPLLSFIPILRFLFISFIFIFSIFKLKKHPWFFVGLSYFLGTLVPVIGLLQVGSQAYADRYTYLPHLGLLLLLGAFLQNLWDNKSQIVKITILLSYSLWLLYLAMQSFDYLPKWKNSFLLFSHANNLNPNNIIAHLNLGSYFLIHQKYKEALPFYLKAIELGPNNPKAHERLGKIYFELGQLDKAYLHLSYAEKLGSQGEDIFCSLGALYGQKKNPTLALEYFQKSLKFPQKKETTHYNLGKLYLGQGQLQKAEVHLKDALTIQPESDKTLIALGLLHMKKGDMNSALKVFIEALKLSPKNPKTLANLGPVYYSLGQKEKAIHHLTQAIELPTPFPQALINRGIIFFKERESSQAIKDFKQASALDPHHPTPHYYLRLIYQQKQQTELEKKEREWLEKKAPHYLKK